MIGGRTMRLSIVAGEESGDLLGADLVSALAQLNGDPVALSGVGGRHLQALGLQSLFDGSEIALMGVTAVLKDLPRLIRRIDQTAQAIVRARPDCLVTIDSPDFSLRVAKKVRAADPTIPIVHYVCPSVWAWRPGRAPAMKPYIDEILCVLPFEPKALERLGGPRGAYVGHRLTANQDAAAAAAAQAARGEALADAPLNLLVLPGSRRGEVSRLMEPFGETIKILRERGNDFQVTIPTVPHVASMVRTASASWPVSPNIVEGDDAKWRAFGAADAALAASGTVLLELTMARVPMLSCYRPDWIANRLRHLITTWSAALPNLIADWPVVPEYYNEFVRPQSLARMIEQLWSATPARAAQLDGLAQIVERMAMPEPPGVLAARTVLQRISMQT